MKLVWSEKAWDDYLEWQHPQFKQILKKLNRLLDEVKRTPFEGTGKPEPLKGDLAGFWSRRIDGEHRLVYSATEDTINVVACRYHYA